MGMLLETRTGDMDHSRLDVVYISREVLCLMGRAWHGIQSCSVGLREVDSLLSIHVQALQEQILYMISTRLLM